MAELETWRQQLRTMFEGMEQSVRIVQQRMGDLGAEGEYLHKLDGAVMLLEDLSKTEPFQGERR